MAKNKIVETETVAMPEKTTVDELLQRISQEYESLSRQLKVIARHIEQHRDHLGLEGIQDVAVQCGVQPSAVVRFAKHFGFSGYTELQRIFRDGLSAADCAQPQLQVAHSRGDRLRRRQPVVDRDRA